MKSRAVTVMEAWLISPCPKRRSSSSVRYKNRSEPRKACRYMARQATAMPQRMMLVKSQRGRESTCFPACIIRAALVNVAAM